MWVVQSSLSVLCAKRTQRRKATTGDDGLLSRRSVVESCMKAPASSSDDFTLTSVSNPVDKPEVMTHAAQDPRPPPAHSMRTCAPTAGARALIARRPLAQGRRYAGAVAPGVGAPDQSDRQLLLADFAVLRRGHGPSKTTTKSPDPSFAPRSCDSSTLLKCQR